MGGQYLPFLRYYAYTCTQTYAASAICVLLLPLDWFMPLETTLFNKGSLSVFLAVPLSYFGMLCRTFPRHCHCLACVLHVLNLLSVLLKSLNQKYSLQDLHKTNTLFRGEKNPCHALGFSLWSMT